MNGTTPSKPFHVAIIGGGIAGLTLAVALYKRSVPFTIYEQAPAFGEIGAGVSFSSNAIQAMRICDHGIYEAFERVCTRNLWPSKQKVWFDFLDGLAHSDPDGETNKVEKPIFTIMAELGQNGVHRAHFLDELVKLLPEGVARFGKRLARVTEEGVRQVLHFEDGSTATADVVVGCDGIKSKVRQMVVGDDHASVKPSYTYKYAYRGLVPMEDAAAAVGEEHAQNASIHTGRGAHVLTFPVNHGKTLNIVAFKTTDQDWPDPARLTRSGTQEELLKDFADFGPAVTKLLKLTKPDLDVWAIFDTGTNPVPIFYKTRICITGDAAHATSPHHGAGAGLCIEDSAVLAELLSDPSVTDTKHLEAVLATFDAERRPRGHWLIQSSRHIGDCYERRAKGVGDDFGKMERDIVERNGVIANVSVRGMVERAREGLRERLGVVEE